MLKTLGKTGNYYWYLGGHENIIGTWVGLEGA